MSCPVCYESFVYDSAAKQLPRRLSTCGDVICSACISNDHYEGSYYCPECATESRGHIIDDFTTVILSEDQLTGGSSRANSAEGDIVSSVAHNKSNRHESVGRLPCKAPGCNNKAIAFEMCLAHAQFRRRSVDLLEQITTDIRNTKLDISYAVITTSDSAKKEKIHDLEPDTMKEHFRHQGTLSFTDAIDIIEKAKSIMIREPNIVRLDAPIIAVGDIHGQYYDLLNLLEEGGAPGTQETYLFLGDYVDRGSFSCEVMLLLLSLKIKFPEKIWLLRGNHECNTVSGHFGFKQECKVKYGVNVYYKFLLCFQTMPIAALISTAYGDIFACHGGISPTLKTLDDIEKLDRFVEPESDLSLLDILWSDPITDDQVEGMTEEEYNAFIQLDFKYNPMRGCSYCFGYKALKEFLDRNKLVCLVRAHEVQKDGYKKHYDSIVVEERMKSLIANRVSAERSGATFDDLPPLITIFSAPNYCDRYENRGAILRIDMALDEFRIIQYDCVEHPTPEVHENESENHILAIVAICPYMPTSFKELVRIAVELGPEENLIYETEESHKDQKSIIRNKSNESLAPTKSCTATDDTNFTNNEDVSNSSCEIQRISPTTLPLDSDESRESISQLRISSASRRSSLSLSKKERRSSVSISLVRDSSRNIFAGIDDIVSTSATDGTNVDMNVADDMPQQHSGYNDCEGNLPLKRWRQAAKEVIHRRYSLKGMFSDEASELYNKALASDAINEVHPETLYRQDSQLSKDISLLKDSLKSTSIATLSVKDLRKRFESGIHSSDDSSFSRVSIKPTYDITTEVPSFAPIVKRLQEKFGGSLSDKKYSDVSPQPRVSRRHSVGATGLRKSITEQADSAVTPGVKVRALSLEEKSKSIESTDASQAPVSCSEEQGSVPSAALVSAIDSEVLFSDAEIVALRLMFSLFDRKDSSYIEYEDLVAYAEETDDTMGIRDAESALEIMDIDGDAKIGMLDFLHFAARLKGKYRSTEII